MKSIFLSTCLLIPLILFFVIIDHNDFYHHEIDKTQNERKTLAGKQNRHLRLI